MQVHLQRRISRRRGQLSGQSELLEPRIVLTTLLDDADSHRWIGEEFGGDPNTVDWGTFEGREALRSVVSQGSVGYTVIRTDGFPAEDWSEVASVQADVFVVDGPVGVDLKLEPRGPGFDPRIEEIVCANVPLNAWHTCTFPLQRTLPAYDEVSHLSFVFDQFGSNSPTFYVDDIRLVGTDNISAEWDDMDDGSRDWFYSGNWFDWLPDPPRKFGHDPITANGSNPATPAGAVYLEWDHQNGTDTSLNTAEVGTGMLDDQRNWSAFSRIRADIRISDPTPLSVFLFDGESGFGTPTRRPTRAGEWTSMVWDLPWPPGFNQEDIRELKFIVNDIDQTTTGNLYVDNIELLPPTSLPPVEDGTEYAFAAFDRETFPSQGQEFTEFSTNWGELLGEHVTTTVRTPEAKPGEPEPGADESRGSLEVTYRLPEDSFTGMFFSLWGSSDCREGGPPDRCTTTQSIDFTDVFGPLETGDTTFDQVQFWVRGSGLTDNTHNIKVELKDVSDRFDRTAYRYITIDDSNTEWQQIVLDADVLNSEFWSYNVDPPDPTAMKFLVFVAESFFNDHFGTFYVDDIRFVDADEEPVDEEQLSDDAFLDLISERTFSYFLDWYDPVTGLYYDRSSFPDLMSIAATGFGLTALTIGEERGWIDRQEAIDRIVNTLTKLRDGQGSTDPDDLKTRTNGYRGFFYHFLGVDGNRKDSNTELSSVDTALLVMGALSAREHFSDVPQIVELADTIAERVEWEWMLGSAHLPTEGTPPAEMDRFFLGWKPEVGDQGEGRFEIPDAEGIGFFSSRFRSNPNDRAVPAQWDWSTDEVMLINILALAYSDNVSLDIFYAWTRQKNAYPDFADPFVTSFNGSFFTYFFAHLWIDFRDLGKDNHPETPVDWWDNSVQAAIANRRFAIDRSDGFATCTSNGNYTTYGENSWGLTAADGPDRAYHAYGAAPVASITQPHHDGTIAPYGAGSGIMFTPTESIAALRHYYSGTELWNERLGLGDAYNLDPPDCHGPWYDRALFGIDNGPMLIGIENHRSDFVTETIGRNDRLRAALGELFGPPPGRPLVVSNAGHEQDGVHTPGELTLPEAVAIANSREDIDEIVFDPRLTGTTITVQSPLVITASLSITGLSAQTTNISGGNTTSVFVVSNSSPEQIDVGISHLTVAQGAGTADGGGLVNHENLTLSDVWFLNNSAAESGGAIAHESGTLTIHNSLFAHNHAQHGGAMLLRSGNVTVVNSTISENEAGASGGGIRNLDAATTFRNTTIAENRAGTEDTNGVGGGLRTKREAVTLHNTIVAGNQSGLAGLLDDVSGRLNPTSPFNLVSDPNSAGGLTDGVLGNIIGDGAGVAIDVRRVLNPLAEGTQSLPEDSPAVHAGSNDEAVDEQGDPLPTDQRHQPRRIGEVDMGAFERLLNAADDQAFTTLGTPVVISPDANDLPTDRTVVSAVAGPANGTATILTSSDVRYVPDAGFTGDDAFEYLAEVTRAAGSSGSATSEEGNAVSVSGAWAVVGARRDDVAGTNSGTVFVYRRFGADWQFRQELQPLDPGERHRFGYSVAISGTTIVIGARLAPVNGPKSGAAYVFEFDAAQDAFVQTAKLTDDEGAPGDQFGHSVAVARDTIVVGARLDDGGGGSNSGAAIVFARSDTGWTQTHRLKADDATTGDQFGSAVSISGDTIVVGAWKANVSDKTDAGAAYVFQRNLGGASVWGQAAKLTTSDPKTNDWFGAAASIEGDAIAIGKPIRNGRARAGAVSSFERNAGGADAWGLTQEFVSPNSAIRDRFGASVALGGGFLAVGAESDDTAANNAGAAWVYSRGTSADDWAVDRSLFGTQGEAFGSAVAISDQTVLVGANLSDASAKNSGAVYAELLESGTATITVTVGQNQIAASAAGTGPVVGSIARDDITTLLEAAMAYWEDRTPGSRARLQGVQFEVRDLPGLQLGLQAGTRVVIDTNAAGHGWFVDPTPSNLRDDAFGTRMDLLSTITHEMGHVLGRRDQPSAGRVMSGSLRPGSRTLIEPIDLVFREFEEGIGPAELF